MWIRSLRAAAPRTMARNPGSVQDVHVTEQSEGAGCTVVVLAPHQGDGATLCRLPSAVGPEAACALPTVAVSAEPDIEEVIREVSRLVGEPVTLLRANAAAWDAGFDTIALIAEIGPLSAEPDGFCWVLLNDRDIETIDPAWARASMRSRTHERTAGAGRPLAGVPSRCPGGRSRPRLAADA
jgi:hypothetical protein